MTTAAIAQLNDNLRTTMFPALGRVLMTQGFATHPRREDFITLVRQFDAFTEDNDPHGEHDFGAVELDGEKVFWKIDYYDKTMENGSEDPADPAVTARVLTLMLAEEY